ncbi:hypothetical protein [Pseudoclavibacter sp. VKM Ac-2888]|uniref:hypothetical protein n=1 Tax=Pseudoclavibacter sp. VKM Ac-2888 TaxID=2783830 RepID=UPI00188D52B8|nr:hypothetical protein [Pseudoclavibacter sp. VKM Ac-2888]MBF4549302.1 hypothetical protein [Pseudoclavibacter sp. VKM Ac-2888]
MTATAHTIPAATSMIQLVPVIERGPSLDRGHTESVRTMRGILVGLAIVVPFWGAVIAGAALLLS